jgi:hypothetical protein
MPNTYTAEQNKQAALLVNYVTRHNPIYIYDTFESMCIQGVPGGM